MAWPLSSVPGRHAGLQLPPRPAPAGPATRCTRCRRPPRDRRRRGQPRRCSRSRSSTPPSPSSCTSGRICLSGPPRRRERAAVAVDQRRSWPWWPSGGRPSPTRRRLWSGRCGSSTPVPPTWRPSSRGPWWSGRPRRSWPSSRPCGTRVSARRGRGAGAARGGRRARRRGVRSPCRSSAAARSGWPRPSRRAERAEAVVDAELAERRAERRTGRPRRCPPICSPATTACAPHHDGVAVARLVGGRCDGCHLALAQAALERIRTAPPDEVVECEECGRLLAR